MDSISLTLILVKPHLLCDLRLKVTSENYSFLAKMRFLIGSAIKPQLSNSRVLLS